MPDEGARRRGVVAYSSGNHGHAVAAAASAVGGKAVIVLPSTAPKIKVENCRWWNAEVVFYDPQREDRAELGRALIEERGMTLVAAVLLAFSGPMTTPSDWRRVCASRARQDRE